MTVSKARITALGSYVPTRVLTNSDLGKLVETNDEWITQRTGIKGRRIADEKEFTSDLCVKAVEHLMGSLDQSVEDVDLVIVCTMTPDFHMPSAASQVQAKLGIQNAGAIDLNAACAGFTYGLHVANGLITAGLNKKVLVIGAETMSKIMDYTDRSTCILFGDGAGAALVEFDDRKPSFISSHLGSNGEAGIHLYSTNLSSEMNGVALKDHGFIVQNGRQVYKWALTTVPDGMQKVMEASGMSLSEVTWFVPHSANLRMIESICEKSGFPIDRTLYSMVHYGNTSSASIPLALHEGVRDGRVKAGDNVLLYGFGGGLTHCGLLVELDLQNGV
jgi:3-oxoacyl-[acyl-carrier-protein] synthase III